MEKATLMTLLSGQVGNIVPFTILLKLNSPDVLVDNDALCASFPTTSFCNQILSLKSVIASQSASLPSPSPHPICQHCITQLLEQVAASEVFRMLSLPSKTSVLDFVPTLVLESRPASFSGIIALLVNPFFFCDFVRGISIKSQVLCRLAHSKKTKS
jgi:hypothetical protein